MNITERENIRQYLESLKGPGNLPLDLWSDLVEEAMRTTFPPESPILNRLKTLRTSDPSISDSKEQITESQLSSTTSSDTPSGSSKDVRLTAYPLYLSAAQLYLGRLQTDIRDESLERQILSIIDDKFLETRIVKLARWVVTIVIPAVIALVVGGTVWGGFQVQGVVKSIKDKFDSDTKAVENSRDNALRLIKDMLGDDSRGILHEIQIARNDSITAINKALDDAKLSAQTEIDNKRVDATGAIQNQLEQATQAAKNVNKQVNAASSAATELDRDITSAKQRVTALVTSAINDLTAQKLTNITGAEKDALKKIQQATNKEHLETVYREAEQSVRDKAKQFVEDIKAQVTPAFNDALKQDAKTLMELEQRLNKEGSRIAFVDAALSVMDTPEYKVVNKLAGYFKETVLSVYIVLGLTLCIFIINLGIIFSLFRRRRRGTVSS